MNFFRSIMAVILITLLGSLGVARPPRLVGVMLWLALALGLAPLWVHNNESMQWNSFF